MMDVSDCLARAVGETDLNRFRDQQGFSQNCRIEAGIEGHGWIL
jgi:hypothetical protein